MGSPAGHLLEAPWHQPAGSEALVPAGSGLQQDGPAAAPSVRPLAAHPMNLKRRCLLWYLVGSEAHSTMIQLDGSQLWTSSLGFPLSVDLSHGHLLSEATGRQDRPWLSSCLGRCRGPFHTCEVGVGHGRLDSLWCLLR